MSVFYIFQFIVITSEIYFGGLNQGTGTSRNIEKSACKVENATRGGSITFCFFKSAKKSFFCYTFSPFLSTSQLLGSKNWKQLNLSSASICLYAASTVFNLKQANLTCLFMRVKLSLCFNYLFTWSPTSWDIEYTAKCNFPWRAAYGERKTGLD